MAARFSAWRRERPVKFPKWWTLALIFAWLAPGGLWLFALLVSFGVASHACYPAIAPALHWLWSGAPYALRGFNIVCIAVSLRALAGGAIDWRETKRAGMSARSGSGDPRSAVEGALAYASTLAALVLWFALFVNGIEIWLTSRCGPA
jgi:hypothetical protein